MEISQDASKVLREEILEQSRREAENVLESARKEADRLISEAGKEAKSYHEHEMKIAQDQADQIEKKILSSVHLELKKQTMRMRETLINRMLEALAEQLNTFRGKEAYRPFLERLIVQGIVSLESDSVNVMLPSKEKELIDQKKISEHVKNENGQEVSIKIRNTEEDEGGALIFSEDGRTRFDNRFSALIRRNLDLLRLAAIKEVFGGQS